MPGPGVPSTLMPWATLATDDDSWQDPYVYLPLVKAINERLIAALHLPLPEDQIHSQFSGDIDIHFAPIVNTPSDTLWGSPAVTIESAYGYLLGRPLNQTSSWFVPGIVQSIIDSSNLQIEIIDTAVPSGASPTWQTGDYILPATYSGTLVVGDSVLWLHDYFSFVSYAYPSYTVGAGTGYSTMQSAVVFLTHDFTDYDPNGATRQTIYNLCHEHSLWEDIYGWSGYGGDYYYKFLIPTLFDRYGSMWPPRTPPTGWPTGKPYGGFTRKREREITSLGDVGTDGQVARFIYSIVGQYDDGNLVFNYFDPSQTDPGSLPHPPTPLDQRQYSSKVMLHTGGSWTVHSDQTTSVDIVSFLGFAQRGDIVGPWIVNELKEAINLLMKSVSSSQLVSPSALQHRLNIWHNGAEIFQPAGSGADSYPATGGQAAALADYAACTNNNVLFGVTSPLGDLAGSFGTIEGHTTGNFYYCQTRYTKIYLFHPGCPCSRIVNVYLNSDIVGTGLSPALNAEFDDNTNLDITNYVWAKETRGGAQYNGKIFKFETTGATSADHVDFSDVGKPRPAATITWPATPAPGATKVHCGGANFLGYIFDWTPGFIYQ